MNIPSSPTKHPKRIAIIYNPMAGRGRASKRVEQARQLANQQGWSVVACAGSTHAGQIENELAPALGRQADLIILIGGDGTLRELIAGLRAQHLQPEIAFIPMGNANVVARELGIPLDASKAIEMLRSSQAKAIDIGILNMLDTEQQTHAMVFLAMLEIGIGARIVHLVNQLRSGKLQGLYQLWGDLVYALAGLLAFLQNKAEPVFYQLPEHEQSKQLPPKQTTHLLVANMHTYAKGWSLTPLADCRDGLLDLAISKKSNRLADIATFIAASQKKSRHQQAMHYAQTRGLTLKGKPSLFMQVDGDPVRFSGEARISIEPGACFIHVPA